MPADPPPALVTLHLWQVSSARIPSAVARMALDRARLRRTPGLRFAKLLGTGDGRTFTLRDATPRRWALLATWASSAAAAGFEDSAVAVSWSTIAQQRLRVDLRPLSSRGRWSGREPFGAARDRVPAGADGRTGAVAALTRARISPRKAVTFWRAVPPVATDLHQVSGLRMALGLGEAPIGVQGTFSLWDSAAALRAFAYQRAAHQEVIRRTAEERWYGEELFARFAVLGTHGGIDGLHPLRWGGG